MKFARLSLALCALMLFGCATTGSDVPNDADAYIRATGPRFMEAFNRGNWAAVSAFYTDDAVVLAPNAEIARGPAAIGQAFAAFGPMRPSLNLSTDRVIQACDMAYEYGTYRMQLTPPGGAPMTDRGKYLTIFRRMPNGEWKISADMFNTSLPAPGV